MKVFFRDMRILQTGTRLLRILYLAKTALTVGIIVFTALEIGRAARTAGTNRSRLRDAA